MVAANQKADENMFQENLAIEKHPKLKFIVI
jgi:hypothetical protein